MKPGLQRMRKKRGYSSAREFAEHIGWSVGSYTNYEQGTREMTLKVAWELADYLECSLDEIAGREWKGSKSTDETMLESLADEDRVILNRLLRRLSGDGAIESSEVKDA